MDYLTEEELFELQHQDELDALNDLGPFDPYENSYFPLPGKENSSKISDIKEAVSDPNIKSSELNQDAQSSIETGAKALDDSSGDLLSFQSESKNSFLSSQEEEKENLTECVPELTAKNSKRKVLETISISDKEEISENHSVRRKLFHSSENYLYDDPPSDDELVIDLGESESLLPQSDKRKASCLSDEEQDSQDKAKKRCTANDSNVESFLRGMMQSQARPSLFSEIISFEKLPLTRSDGRRIYFSLNEEESETNVQTFSQKTSSLLTVPIESLKSQCFIMEEEILKKQDSECCDGITNEMEVEPIIEETTNAESYLWVEKYHPTSYMHLLSEEGINRTLLQWLKLWDKVVFGKERKVKKKPADNKKEVKQTKFQKQGELIEDLDEHGRPHHKVAFLCGPPGLGKTTLANIIAKHAGYNVVEINASDDRNPETFRTSLEAATQMKSVLDKDHRPNCLILDEIDGAPAASINVLLSFIKSVGIPKGKRKKGDIPLLMRPIICICNDQYSAALKPLRQLALMLNFPPTLPARLTARLHEVSSKEGFAADLAALTKLCEKTGNDIRSCLSTLQFLHRKKTELKVSDVEGLHIGQKDMQKSLFAVWQDIFHFTDKKSFNNIFHIIQAFGDYEKVYVGMFENYLNTKFKHRNIDTVWQGAEWMCFGDIIQQQIAHSQLYFLLPYLPYPAVAFHMLYSSNAFAHISYPSAYYEHRAKGSQLSNTLSSMIKDMVTSLKTFLNPTMLLIDVFPFLLEVIKPNLRPVNTQLYSEREKSELRRVIELMLAFNLSYHQERSFDGTYNYILDPNIEEIIRFSDIKPKRILTYSAKQMIAREVEMEQMRKGDTGADEKAVKLVKNTAPKSQKPKILPKKDNLADKPVVDFFGRVVVQTAKLKTAGNKDPRDEEVWFHFKEGYSNAVRRTVYIKDLL